MNWNISEYNIHTELKQPINDTVACFQQRYDNDQYFVYFLNDDYKTYHHPNNVALWKLKSLKPFK